MTAKKAAPFMPVPAGTQRRQHQRQVARMAHWKPLTFSQQRQQHRAAQQKAAKAAAHHHHHKAKHHPKAKKHGWTPDGDVALCVPRAVAESLRLALGVTITDEDVLDLYWSVAGSADEGAAIPDVLGAVHRGGLHGHRPVFKPLAVSLQYGAGLLNYPVICGVDCPQPHAVVACQGVWWSWGEPWEPWTDQVTEAWAVTWRP